MFKALIAFFSSTPDSTVFDSESGSDHNGSASVTGINPATGLAMLDDTVDIEGNVYGTGDSEIADSSDMLEDSSLFDQNSMFDDDWALDDDLFDGDL